MGSSHMCLSAIIDWRSRYIVGWELFDALEAAPVVSAMREAMERCCFPAIADSDPGSQFASDLYIELMVSADVRWSMERGRNTLKKRVKAPSAAAALHLGLAS
jgi:putative transposase